MHPSTECPDRGFPASHYPVVYVVAWGDHTFPHDDEDDARSHAQWLRSRGNLVTLYRERQRWGTPIRDTRRYMYSRPAAREIASMERQR